MGFGIALFRFTGYFRWAAVTVGVLGCILLSGSGSEILSSILVAMGKSPTFSGRTYLWSAAAGLIADKWLLGYGLSTINDVSIASVFFAVSGEVHDAHNSYLELAIALGLVGLFLHLATIVDAVFRALRARLSVSGDAARQCLLLIIIMWCIAALAEAAPFLPSEPVEAFGLFAVVWLSASPLSRGRGGSGDGEVSTSSRAKLSVTQSGRRKGAKSHLELD